MNVIGSGRIGSYLAKVFNAKVYTRAEDDYLSLAEGPIFITTRNDSLAALINKLPEHRRQDLVFVQNGMYQDLLKSAGGEQATLMLIFFAIQKKGDTPIDGKGTVVTGRHAALVCEHLTSAGIDVKAIKKQDFQKVMFEKLLWNSVFGLFCRIYNSSVGELVRNHYAEMESLTNELIEICESYSNVELPDNIFESMCHYSMKVSSYRGDVKEWEWRNGWFLSQERSPIHLAFLQQAKLDFDI